MKCKFSAPGSAANCHLREIMSFSTITVTKTKTTLTNLSFTFFCFITLTLLHQKANALYEDQVGKFDWRRQFIGEPKFVYHCPGLNSIIVGTEENIVASISITDGSIIWRNLLPKTCIMSNMFALKPSDDLDDLMITTSCNNSNESFSWNAQFGLLVSETRLQYLLKYNEQAESESASEGQKLEQILNGHSSPRSLPHQEIILKAFPISQDKLLTGAGHIANLILLVTNELEVSLWTSDGELIWTREESLASVEAVEFVNLPLSEEDAEIAQELSSKGSPFEALFNRVHSQYHQLCQMIVKAPQSFVDILKKMFNRFILLNVDDANNIVSADYIRSENLYRDRFGLRKLILLVTRNGNIFGLDTFTGQVIWKIYEKDLSTSNLKSHAIIIVTKESDFSSDPRFVVVHPSGIIIEINPIFGHVVQKVKFHKIKQIITTEIDEESKTKGILMLDVENQVHIYPEEYLSKIKQDVHKYFMTIVEPESINQRLIGYRFVSKFDKIESVQSWEFALNGNEKIYDVGIKPVDEVVHSPARILGDRGVLYKYINPNLVAIVTQGSLGNPCSPEYYTNIYLLDSITGALVHSIHHPKARATAQLVHSENWLVYAYYNIKSRRTEISSLEMFEGSNEHSSPVFSSFARSSTLKPKLIEHKSFIFPSGIDVMVATTTMRAMTNRHLIVALPSGSLLEIPKIFLDPRRPINMLMEHREEGLIPYMPELPIPSESMINYNQTLLGIRKIVTSPSYLESTSLVFEYGLDLFFTRVTPSKTFDILKDDFDHLLITAVLIFLVVASYVTKLLAQRKALHAAW